MSRAKWLVLLLLVIGVACKDDEKTNDTYPQDLVTKVAYLVIENNDEPNVTASGFLVEREKGLFLTAKHFTSVLNKVGTRQFKLFFNGKVYDAELVQLPPLRDAALIRIVSNFDYNSFSEAAVFSQDKVKIGDKVFVVGFHQHHYRVRSINEKMGHPDKVVPIRRLYYHIETRDTLEEAEVVFDSLEAQVVGIETRWWLVPGNRAPNFSDSLRYRTNPYFDVFTERYHFGQFGGLSGGPVFNEKGEIVGIVTLGEDGDGGRILMMTPIWYLKDLENYIKEFNP